MTRISTLLLGLTIALLMPSPLGFVVGALLAAFGPLVIEHLEPGVARKRREDLQRALPQISMTLAVCAQAGLSLPRSFEACLAVAQGHAREEIQRTLRAMDTGYQLQAITDLGQRVPQWTSITVPLGFAINVGAPVGALLRELAHDEVVAYHERVMISARKLGVKATIPVALLLLPAFVLLGVVPLVISLASSLIPSL